MICVLLIAGGLMLVSGFQYEPKVHYWAEFDESVLGLVGWPRRVYGRGRRQGEQRLCDDENKAHCDLLIRENKVQLRQGVTAQLVLYSLATGTMCISLEGGDRADRSFPRTARFLHAAHWSRPFSTQIESVSLTRSTRHHGHGQERPGGHGRRRHRVAHGGSDGLILRGQEFLDKANTTLGDVKGQAQSGLDEFRDLAERGQEARAGYR